MRKLRLSAGLTASAFLLLSACMEPGSDSTLGDAYLAAQPAGWLGICERVSGDPYCRPLEFTPERMGELRQVQAEIRYANRLASGERENPAIAARARLQQRGWPARALRVAQVVGATGEPHSVLAVEGRHGASLATYVLDSRFAAVHRLDELDYS